jgi:DNA-binding NtrC family response regulator
VVPITLPPLRERKEDILPLIDYFLKKHDPEERLQIISDDVLNILISYHWPGNIRELENVVEHALVMSSGSKISVECLPEYLRRFWSNHSISNDQNISLFLESGKLEGERGLIIKTLAETGNNRSEAMKRLQMSRRTFYKKLKKYDIQLSQ